MRLIWSILGERGF